MAIFQGRSIPGGELAHVKVLKKAISWPVQTQAGLLAKEKMTENEIRQKSTDLSGLLRLLLGMALTLNEMRSQRRHLSREEII